MIIISLAVALAWKTGQASGRPATCFKAHHFARLSNAQAKLHCVCVCVYNIVKWWRLHHRLAHLAPVVQAGRPASERARLGRTLVARKTKQFQTLTIVRYGKLRATGGQPLESTKSPLNANALGLSAGSPLAKASSRLCWPLARASVWPSDKSPSSESGQEGEDVARAQVQ